MKLIFATKNKGKMKEINNILAGSALQVISMEEAGFDMDVIEDGETFEQNAMKKAIEIMKASGMPVLSDDSGLEVDALDKKPGVYSARFLGESTPFSEKNKKILELLKDVSEKERSARFVCVIAAAFPEGRTLTARGELEGQIAFEIKGEHGFGYDPIVYIPEYGMTVAQMTEELKNEVSHRGKALRMMKELLERSGVK